MKTAILVLLAAALALAPQALACSSASYAHPVYRTWQGATADLVQTSLRDGTSATIAKISFTWKGIPYSGWVVLSEHFAPCGTPTPTYHPEGITVPNPGPSPFFMFAVYTGMPWLTPENAQAKLVASQPGVVPLVTMPIVHGTVPDDLQYPSRNHLPSHAVIYLDPAVAERIGIVFAGEAVPAP